MMMSEASVRRGGKEVMADLLCIIIIMIIIIDHLSIDYLLGSI